MTDGRPKYFGRKAAAFAGGIAGICLAAWLLKSYGLRSIIELIGRAGWFGMLAVVVFHGSQMLCSALGWREIAGPAPPRERLRTYFVLRWIREAVNNLLPLAQIGGEIVAWRLLRQRGAKLPNAIAGTVADLTLEMVSQAFFTLLGVLLLLMSVGGSGVATGIGGGLLVASMLIAALAVAVRFGLAEVVENGLLRIGRRMGWAGASHVEGLNQALMDRYRQPGRLARSALWHMLSWLLGGVEVRLALHFLGTDVSIESCLVIESLGQAAKALGFAVPGALGVQEGGYVIICRAFGLPADLALALSLIKRLREVVLGVPALIMWQHYETKVRSTPDNSITGITP
jgi:putative membrane protein